jgi:hypothetical protein
MEPCTVGEPVRTRVVLISLALLFGAASLAVFLRMASFDTTLEVGFRDSVSGQWVWDATARIQDRLLRAFYQSDAGPVPFVFSRLKPGASTLQISAPGYSAVSIPVKLRRGANRIAAPIEMQGFEIPDLKRFYVFEQLDGVDMLCQLRPVGSNASAVVNHPCLPIWIGCRVSVQLRNGKPAPEPADTGNTRGEELFNGSLAWIWDARPETSFRYSARIPGSRIKANPALYRVIDYLVVVPDPRRIGAAEFGALMKNAPSLSDEAALGAYLSRQGGNVRYFFDTSWNAMGRSE